MGGRVFSSINNFASAIERTEETMIPESWVERDGDVVVRRYAAIPSQPKLETTPPRKEHTSHVDECKVDASPGPVSAKRDVPSVL